MKKNEKTKKRPGLAHFLKKKRYFHEFCLNAVQATYISVTGTVHNDKKRKFPILCGYVFCEFAPASGLNEALSFRVNILIVDFYLKHLKF